MPDILPGATEPWCPDHEILKLRPLRPLRISAAQQSASGENHSPREATHRTWELLF
ncbi:hypothetical protein [Streptomyces sp. LN500]|uniref:hypothetical protein n=1 Tax=Streptomyces sp. LN500 TaxID=3112978 RepID=UPI00371DB601